MVWRYIKSLCGLHYQTVPQNDGTYDKARKSYCNLSNYIRNPLEAKYVHNVVTALQIINYQQVCLFLLRKSVYFNSEICHLSNPHNPTPHAIIDMC